MLDADLKTQLQAYLEKVARPIEIVASLDDSDKSRELEELLGEIVAAFGQDQPGRTPRCRRAYALLRIEQPGPRHPPALRRHSDGP